MISGVPIPALVSIPIAFALAVTTSNAQEPISETAMRGPWAVSGSAVRETWTFSSQGDLLHSYTMTKKDGKEVPPTRRDSEGAYKFAAHACSVGNEKGNLWIAKESYRCCFNGYFMGKTLVLDAIQGATPTFPRSLCASKTLKREGPASTK